MHAKRFGLHLLAYVLLWTSSSAVAQQLPPETITDRETYQVFNRLLPLRYEGTTRIVIRRETYGTPGCLPSGAPFQNEWQSVLENYKVENARPAVFDRQFQFDVPYELVTLEELKQLNFVSPAFHTRFPKALRYFLLSRVGFDETRNRAMAWISQVCGGLCGSGRFYFMQRQQDGSWSRAALGDFQNCSIMS